jgi:hypothetical protein
MTTLRASPAMKQAMVENLAAASADQSRLSEREKVQLAAVKARAARIVAVPCDDEAGARLILRCMAREVHARIVLTEGQHEADTLFASIARKGAEVPNARRDAARAEAERVFGHANDE